MSVWDINTQMPVPKTRNKVLYSYCNHVYCYEAENCFLCVACGLYVAIFFGRVAREMIL
jgi:hypothetical protein